MSPAGRTVNTQGLCNEPAKRNRLGRSGTFMVQWFRRWTVERATRGSIPARSVTTVPAIDPSQITVIDILQQLIAKIPSRSLAYVSFYSLTFA